MHAFSILECPITAQFIRFASPVGARSQSCRIQRHLLLGRKNVKELSLEEVLRIAGGVPVSAALDELTYRAPEDPASDPVDYALLLGVGLRDSEPV
jgi:hypothetical protein